MKLSKPATTLAAIQLASAIAPVVASADTISDVVDKAHKAGLDVKVEKSKARATSQAEADRLNAEQAKQLTKDAQTISTKIDTYVKEKQDVASYNKTITTTTKTQGSVDAAKIQEVKDQNAKIERENAAARADYLKRLDDIRKENEKKQRDYEAELARIREENSEDNRVYLEELARVRAENTKRINEYQDKLAKIRDEVNRATTAASNGTAIAGAQRAQSSAIIEAVEENQRALAAYERQLAEVDAKNKAAADEYAKQKAVVESANDKAQRDYEAALARYEADKAELDKRPVFATNGVAQIRGQYNESARGSVDYFNQFGLVDSSYNGESLSEPITYKEGTSRISNVQGMNMTESTFNGFDNPMSGVLFSNITNGASFMVSNVSRTTSGEVVNMKVTIVDRGRSMFTATDGTFKAWLLHDDGAFGWEILDGDRLGIRYELYTESGTHLSVPTFNIINDIDYKQGSQFEFSGGEVLTKAPEGSGIERGSDGIFWDVNNAKYSGWNSSPGGTLMAVGYGDITYTHYSNRDGIYSSPSALKQSMDAIGRKADDVDGYYYAIFGRSSLLKTAVPPKKPTPEKLPPQPELKVNPPQPKLKEVPNVTPHNNDGDDDPGDKLKKRPTLELLPEPPKPIQDSTDPQPPELVDEPKPPTPKSLNPIPKETPKTVELKKDPNKPELRLQSVEYVYTIKTIWETVDGHVLRPWKDGEQPKDNFNGYEYVRTVKDKDGNIHHIYKPIPKKNVTTIWVTEDGKVLRPRENGEQPKDNFDGYEYVRTEKDKDGNTTHIYRPIPKKIVTTIWVTEDGSVLRPRENGEKPKDNFNGYEYVRTEKDKDGNTTHIYRPIPKKNVTTIWVTEDGKVLRPRENGEQPKDNFDGYEYVRTEKDKDGNTTHIYRPIPKKTITTIWVTENGSVLRPRENGEQPKADFDGYEYVRTDKDKDGNVTHIYKSIPKKNVTTIWVTEDGQVLRPRENGEQPKADFDGYTYVRTEKDKDGNIRHIYKPIPKKSVTTIWVTEDGQVLRPRENGEQPKADFDGYEYVRTEKDKDGNIKHIYKPITKPTPVPKQPKETPQAKELPKTGDVSSLGWIGSIVSGLGLVGLRGKKRTSKRARK
jgi:hypothetical protein